MNVLLVEDEALVAIATQDALRDLGCEVIAWAANAADAERLAADQAPDVILMDLRLKGGDDGIDVASRLRATHCAPIIFVSGFIETAMRERIEKLQPSATLPKPYFPDQLRIALDWARGQLARS